MCMSGKVAMETIVKNPDRSPVFEPINLELSPADIQTIMSSYLDFLQLPDEEKSRLNHIDEARPRTGMSGHVSKNKNDIKDVFHMTQVLGQEWSLSRHYKLPLVSAEFLNNAEEAYYSLAKSTKAKYLEFEEGFPTLTGIHFPRSGKLGHHLRFLAYRGVVGDHLAKGHYDKGSGTIAVAESHGGLRLGFSEHDLEQLEYRQDQPVWFAGYGWHQLAEMLDIRTNRRAAWHDVVDTGERLDDETVRWAMVYFIDPANMYLESTQEQTHTPIPWRGMGNLALRSDSKSFLI